MDPASNEWLRPLDDELPLSRVIADRIAGAIVQGELAPGSKLGEEELAKRFRTSRTPVREALRLLEREALVTSTPRKGVRVSVLTRDDAAELYLLRGHLGRLVARLAVANASSDDVALLRDLQAAVEESFAAGDREQFVRCAFRFDELLVSMAGNSLLGELFERLHRKSLRFSIVLSLPIEVFRASMQLRGSLLGAIAEGRAEDAERLVEELNSLTWAALAERPFPGEVGEARTGEPE